LEPFRRPFRALPLAHLIAVAAVVASAVAASPGAAQETGPWKIEGEIGASLFFGNTSQTTVGTRVAAARADSAREVAVDGIFTYGEASDPDGESFVNKRSWAAGATYDHRPYARWSPFALGRVESSYEKRIELRYNVGAGAKLRLLVNERSRADVSVALLAERTNPADVVSEKPELLARWSARARASRSFGDGRISLGSESSWRPRVERIADFTCVTTNTLSLPLSERVGLKLTFVDSYDSEAEGRGARSNNDGQLLLSVLSRL
jgi:hypothetical protein